jgi:hypothetical protein
VLNTLKGRQTNLAKNRRYCAIWEIFKISKLETVAAAKLREESKKNHELPVLSSLN